MQSHSIVQHDGDVQSKSTPDSIFCLRFYLFPAINGAIEDDDTDTNFICEPLSRDFQINNNIIERAPSRELSKGSASLSSLLCSDNNLQLKLAASCYNWLSSPPNSFS